MTGGWGDQLSPRRASPLRCVTGDRSLKSDAPRQSTPSGGTTRRSGVCASNPLSEVYTACPLMRAEAKFNGAHFEGLAGFVQGFGSPGARGLADRKALESAVQGEGFVYGPKRAGASGDAGQGGRLPSGKARSLFSHGAEGVSGPGQAESCRADENRLVDRGLASLGKPSIEMSSFGLPTRSAFG